jgi:hypothetical protein
MVQETLSYCIKKKGRNDFRNYHIFRFETMEFTSKPTLANQYTGLQTTSPAKYTVMATSTIPRDLSQSSVQQLQKQLSHSPYRFLFSITSSIPTYQQWRK